ncbi:TonB-dependent siderophore receptor [Pusillimonas noertemannii]|uniref:Iron complex outermembrane receptor protein n=1 Tax=Pusillimonas noertemannii TaxID=305977 RepID=A0A2U1CI88_9BURK|nr:TonB-dependent siderophore receptor [Pusillimonas noertemannii]NYT70463.1 TonB-dependent siderophore receptor [Pusillimonas noertemannii]PVY60663.1 iron complex outermembrane receptor protein [Pusillimonas noertemannii]TFL08671.1 TonB-dependent siderophore receptor [Pusillimonas noertemannii]
MSHPLSGRSPARTAAILAWAGFLTLGHAPANAQTGSAQPAASGTLAPITVEGAADNALAPVDGYIATSSISASKTDIPLIETPQSVTVITADQIRDQGAQGLQDALNYAAGVRSDAYGLDSRSDNFMVRGASPSVYLDGLRTNFDYYTSTTRTEPFTLERIEVLRGPASMLYGQGSTAGVVNMVTKRPQAETSREVGIQYGSHNRRSIQADLTGAIDEDGKWLYRLVALGRKSDTMVDHVPDDRLVFAPSITWRPSNRTSLTLLALWQDDKSGSTAQFFPWEGTLLDNPNGQIPTNTFIGDPDWDRYDSSRRSIGWAFEHQLNDGWTIRQNARWSYNHVDYRSLYGDSFSLPGGWAADPVNKRLIGRYAWGTDTTVRMAQADQHVQGKFDTGPVSHNMLIGMDYVYAKNEQSTASEGPDTVPLIDAFNPVYPAYTPPAFFGDPAIRQRDMGFYIQDQMRLDNWILVAGLRHDRSENTVDGSPSQVSRATSKRFGLMYAFPVGISPYVSYSESFTPQLGRDSSGDAFVPLRGKQWEAGLKYESPDRNTLVNAAVYTLREENRLVSDPANPMQSIQAGETRTRGFELEVKTTVARQLDLIANYNYLDQDDQLEGEPRHQASLWSKYRFAINNTPGFSVGAGVRWVSAFSDGSGPRVPSATLVDAMVAYDTPQWRLALNANNVFDKTYVATCLERGDCWFGARRSIVASATYKF